MKMDAKTTHAIMVSFREIEFHMTRLGYMNGFFFVNIDMIKDHILNSVHGIVITNPTILNESNNIATP